MGKEWKMITARKHGGRREEGGSEEDLLAISGVREGGGRVAASFLSVDF